VTKTLKERVHTLDLSIKFESENGNGLEQVIIKQSKEKRVRDGNGTLS